MIGYLFIPDLLTPSLNVMLRMHWRKQELARRMWAREVQVARMASADPPCVVTVHDNPRRRVEIERVGGKTLDPDNLRASVKWLLDAIVRAGLLVDDSPKYLDLDVTQRKRAKGEPKGMAIRFYSAAESG